MMTDKKLKRVEKQFGNIVWNVICLIIAFFFLFSFFSSGLYRGFWDVVGILLSGGAVYLGLTTLKNLR